MNRLIDKIRSEYRLIIYTLCGLGLCVIDLWRGIGNGAQWALAVNCTGFCIFPMIALRLDWRALLPGCKDGAGYVKKFRIASYLWLIFSTVLFYPVFKHFAPGTDYDAQILTALINVVIYGPVVIRTYFSVFHEKNELRLKAVFLFWFAFLALAIVSVNKQIWPLWFLVMFGSFYLVPMKSRDLREITLGLVNGIILGFFIIQGRAFLHRPYDGDPRYRGHYTNPNVNAMFYMFVYIAWLIRYAFFRLSGKKAASWICIFFASSMWVFIFLTGCRSAMLGVLGTTVLFWICEAYGVKKKAAFFAARIAMMCVLAVAAFLPVFLCIRYIPPLRHHPVWYQDEYNEDRVMAWDPIDSPKYNDLDEVMMPLLGRFSFLQKMLGIPVEEPESEAADELLPDSRASDERFAGEQISDGSVYDDLLPGRGIMTADASEEPVLVAGHYGENQFSEDGQRIYWYDDGTEPGADEDHPIFVVEEYDSSRLRRVLTIRYYIYRYILGEIRLFGNEELTPAVWILDHFELLHAHNSVLMMAYWFGPVAGIVFLLMLLSGLVTAFIGIRWSSGDDGDKDHGEKRGIVSDEISGKMSGEMSREMTGEVTGELKICLEFTALVITGYLLIGLMECIAFPGELGLVLIFAALLPVVRK